MNDIPTLADKDALVLRMAKLVDANVDEGNLYNALNILDTTIKHDSQNAKLWFFRSKICSKLDMLQGAIFSLDKALDCDPTFEDAIEEKKNVETIMKKRYSMRSYL